MNKRFYIVWCEKQKSKQNKFVQTVIWENLQRAFRFSLTFIQYLINTFGSLLELLSPFKSSCILASLILSWFCFSSSCHRNCSSNSITFCWLFSSSACRLSTNSLLESDSTWRPVIRDLNSASVSAEAV